MSKKRSDATDDDARDEEQLDRVFGALSDPVRRRILQRLQVESQLVSELAAPFDISLQAVSRHIQVLEDAGLVQKERAGRISRCSLSLGPIVNAAVWINRYSRYWQEQFDLLAATLTQIDEQRPATASRATARVRTSKPETRAAIAARREPRAPRPRHTKPR
jgi:DNA-binding transcriptional ArsR family regulator